MFDIPPSPRPTESATEYVVPVGVARLVETLGIVNKIRKLRRETDWHHSCIPKAALNNLISWGVYRDHPDFKERAKLVMWERHPFSPWKVHKLTDTLEVPVSITDEMIFSGYMTALIVGRERMRDFLQHGFVSPTHLFGALGAYFFRRRPAKGEWTTTSGGRTTAFSLGGYNGLTVQKTDITEYDTHDPLGRFDVYRPVSEDCREGIFVHEEIEINFVAVVLNYFRQMGLRPCDEIMELGDDSIIPDPWVRKYFEEPLPQSQTAPPSIGFGEIRAVIESENLSFYSEQTERRSLSLPVNQLNRVLLKVVNLAETGHFYPGLDQVRALVALL